MLVLQLFIGTHSILECIIIIILCMCVHMCKQVCVSLCVYLSRLIIKILSMKPDSGILRQWSRLGVLATVEGSQTKVHQKWFIDRCMIS